MNLDDCNGCGGGPCHGDCKKHYTVETDVRRIGMLRQWLNEDRISEPKNMVTNEEIISWLTLEYEKP